MTRPATMPLSAAPGRKKQGDPTPDPVEMTTAGVYLRLGIMGLVLFVAVPVGLLWRSAARHCESSCDRWSYDELVVFVVTYGPWLLLLLLMCEAAYAQGRSTAGR